MAQDIKQVGAFHKNHGANIHLLEEGTVAHRKDSYNKAVVFTEYPINIGGLFEVKIEDIGGGWAGSLVSKHEFVRIIKYNQRYSNSMIINACYYTATENIGHVILT